MEKDGIAKCIFLGNIHARAEKGSKYAATFLWEQDVCIIYLPIRLCFTQGWATSRFILHALIPPFLQILFKRCRSKEKVVKDSEQVSLRGARFTRETSLCSRAFQPRAGPKDEQEERREHCSYLIIAYLKRWGGARLYRSFVTEFLIASARSIDRLSSKY